MLGCSGTQQSGRVTTVLEENHMLLGVRLMNSLGISGVPFTGMDIGGFTGGPSPSLYIRWMQIGAFIPYFRNHSTLNTRSSEPWTYGEDALPIIRNYINLRYKLLPYIYSSFYEATQNGLPLMRTLAIDNTFDPNVYDAAYQNEYLFGGSFLVAPFESTKDYGKVYFPAGLWYNLYTDEQLQGRQAVIQPLSVSSLPVYVKESSIIPMQSLVQTTAEAPTDTLSLHVYNGSVANEFTYYEDDGKSYGYENDGYYKRALKFSPADHTIIFDEVSGNFKSKFHTVKLIMHGFNGLSQVKNGWKSCKCKFHNL